MKIMNKLSNVKKLHWPVVGLILYYIPFHIFLTPNYWDDATFARMLTEWRGDLLAYTIHRYKMWSSRITIELLLPIITVLPSGVWKMLDLMMIGLLYYDLRWLLRRIFKIESKETDFMLAALLCAFPFSIMAQTGWMATTTNYLWVIALGCFAVTRMLKAAWFHEEISRKEAAGSALAVLYSASFESMAAIIFVVWISLMIHSLRAKDKIRPIMWVCGLITVMMLIYIAACPGNRLRPVSDAERWMPDYFELSFPDKLRMGILSSFMHFVSIPSPVFFILNLMVFLSVRRERAGVKAAAFVPLALDVCWTLYFMVNYLMGYKTMTYQVPTPLPAVKADIIEQILLFISVAVWFAVVLYFMYKQLPLYRAIGGTIILTLACAPEIAVGLTPTVIASILRTMIYLYMAMIILILILYDGKNKKFTYLCIGGGMLLNACQLIRHITLYG